MLQFVPWALLQQVAPFIITAQVLGATLVFFKLNGYNKQNEKRFQTAQAAVGKPSSSLFELPAFRGKTVPAPFENTTWALTRYEQVKLSLVAVTLLPIRLPGLILTFFGTAFVVYVSVKLGALHAGRIATKLGARIFLFFCGYYRIRVRGEQAPGVGVVVSNHCSMMDGLVWVVVSTPRIFAEQGNFASPIMQVFAKSLDIVLFDRGGQESRRQARRMMENAALEAYNGNAAPILVFPTGTTTNLNVMITFKDGAFSPGLPVQPALLRYQFRHCDPAWVFSGPSTPMLLFRLICQVVNWLEVEFLPVAVPDEEEKQEPSKFARRVQLQVAEAMGVPVTEHSVEDLQLQFAAVKNNLPAEVGVVGFAALKEVFSVDADQIKQQMSVFKQMDSKASGLVGFAEFKDCFRRGFHEPSQEQTKLLREFFDQLTGGGPNLDFRKFLIGLALVNENEKDASKNGAEAEGSTATMLPSENFRKKIYAQLAFAAFAAESDDRISWREFRELWNWLHPDGLSFKRQVSTGNSPPPGNGGGGNGGGGSGVPGSGGGGSGANSASNSPALKPSTPRRGSWTSCFPFLSGTSGSPGATADAEVTSSARRVFEEIGGGLADHLTWDMFSAYAEKNPGFEKRLRQAFFSRVAHDLAANAS